MASNLKVGLIEIDKSNLKDNNNIALENRGRIDLDKVSFIENAIVDCDSNLINKLGALMRSNQMAGALESILTQSVRYANERIQFGRPIGKFQAIQQDLAVLSTHVAASSVAADYACSSMDKGNPDFAIAVAKVELMMLFRLELELLIRFMELSVLLTSMDFILQQEDYGHGELSMAQVVNGQKFLVKKRFPMVQINFGLQ